MSGVASWLARYCISLFLHICRETTRLFEECTVTQVLKGWCARWNNGHDSCLGLGTTLNFERKRYKDRAQSLWNINQLHVFDLVLVRTEDDLVYGKVACVCIRSNHQHDLVHGQVVCVH